MLEQKRIIITGAGSGIGRATSLQAAKYGAKEAVLTSHTPPLKPPKASDKTGVMR